MPARRTVLRVLLVALAALGVWVFGQPVVIAGILNLGNLLGLAASVLLAVVGLAWSGVSRLVRALVRTRRGKVLVLPIAATAVLGALWAGVLSVLMVTDRGSPPDVPVPVVLLGCRVDGEVPSEALQNRIDTAADYLLAHPSVPVVVSGGKGTDERISEAEAMRRGLVARGVAEDRILLEDRSTSTVENLTYSAQLLAANGLDASVVIVTEGYHLSRALSVADRVGLDADGLAAPSPGWLLPTSWVREWVALTRDMALR